MMSGGGKSTTALAFSVYYAGCGQLFMTSKVDIMNEATYEEIKSRLERLEREEDR